MTKRSGNFKDALRPGAFFFRGAARYVMRMIRAAAIGFFAAILGTGWSAACRAQDAVTLCSTNPAYSIDVMRNVLAAQLQRDHDPALDAEPPDQMAAEAAQQGIKDCAADLQHNPAIFQALSGLSGSELPVGWDAYNTACADHGGSKGECIKAEIGSVRALKHMVATDQPPGAKSLVEACELVLQTDPPMAEWRSCVDTALAAHADPARDLQCKTTVAWHVAKTGAEAGQLLRSCLQKPS